MVAVIFKPPSDLPPSFRHAAHSKIHVVEDWDARDEDLFAFKRNVGEIRAFLHALESIPCEASLLVQIRNRQIDVGGQIVVWRDPLTALVKDELESFLRDIYRVRDNCSGCHLKIEFSLTRTVKRDA